MNEEWLTLMQSVTCQIFDCVHHFSSSSLSVGYTLAKACSWSAKVRETSGCAVWVIMRCLCRAITWIGRLDAPLEMQFTRSTPALISRWDCSTMINSKMVNGLYTALYSYSKRFYNTSKHSHIHTRRAGDLSTKSQPAHQELIHTHSHAPIAQPLGANWGSVSRPRTLPHIDRRSRGSNCWPSDLVL